MHSNKNPPAEVLSHLRSLVGQAVLIPIPRGKKGPTIRGWEKITYSDTQEDSYQRDLLGAVQRGGNIGVLLGVESGRLLAFDVDADELVEQCRRRCSWLERTLTSRGKRGCQFWLILEEDCNYPSAKAVVTVKRSDGSKLGELRFGGERGAQSVIFGVRPDGPGYQITNAVKPLVISLADLYELTGWAPEQQRKEEPPPAPADEPKLELTPELVAVLNHFVDHCVPAIEHARGDNRTYTVACTLWHDYGLSVEQAWPFLKRYNQRCEPPWKEKDLRRKLEQAAKDPHHRGQRGHLLAHANSADANNQHEGVCEEPKYELSGRNVLDFLNLEIDPTSNLLADRWLTRDGSAFIVAPSGHGKSSLVMQAAIGWSIGRSAFAIRPAQPLRILVVQSEDDDAETKKFSQMIRTMDLSTDERDMLRDNTRFEFRRDIAGSSFISALDQFLTQWPADIAIINPLSGFLLSDLKDDEKVNIFLRQKLNALMVKHLCAPVVVHHTPKLNFTKLDNMQWYDWMYAMSGCAGLTNWGRAVLVIAPSKVPGTYRFIAAKRFDEIQWTQREYWFAHSRNNIAQNGQTYRVIQWVPATEGQIAQARPSPKSKTQSATAQMLWDKMDPIKSYSREAFQEWAGAQFGLGVHKAWNALKLLAQEGLVQVSLEKRPGTNPLKLYQKLARASVEADPQITNHA